MHRPERESSVKIEVRPDCEVKTSNSLKVGFLIHTSLTSLPIAMKIFDRFREIVMRFFFSSLRPSGRFQATTAAGSTSVPRRRSCDRPEPPKTSCSSYYYSSSSHYNEAIADCIEFFNRSSSQEGIYYGSSRKSDVSIV